VRGCDVMTGHHTELQATRGPEDWIS
jgi:hypothetical protein